MDLSVVVVNYNGGDRLRRCLDALLAQRLDAEWEAIVVDNGSEDGSQELVRTVYPSVRLVEAGRNLGFAAGNNLGIRSAEGREIVLLNDDAYPRSGFLVALHEAAAADPAIGAVTAKLVFADRPAVIQNAGCQLLSDGSVGERGAGEPDRGQYDQREYVFGFCGAAALLRAEALADVGLFDRRFFMYYEDSDLSWRMRLRGWRVVYEPAAVVDHEHAATSGEWSSFFTFHVDRNRVLMLLKNARWSFFVSSVLKLGRRVARRGDAAASRPGRRGTQVRVLGSLLLLLPSTLVARVRVRSRRSVADADLERDAYPRELWDARFA